MTTGHSGYRSADERNRPDSEVDDDVVGGGTEEIRGVADDEDEFEDEEGDEDEEEDEGTF